MGDEKILVVGCGGLGGYVIEELARLGVKNLLLCDGDTFCESNRNRQLESGLDTLGKSKAAVYEERLKRKHGVAATAINAYLTEENADLLASVDLVMDCVDTIEARLFLERLCEKYGKILVHGGLEGSCGQVCLCYPGDGTLKKLYRDGREKKHRTNAYTVAAVASMQVSLAEKVLTRRADEYKNKLYLIDMDDPSVETVKL